MLSTSYLHELENIERNAEGQGRSRGGCVHSRGKSCRSRCGSRLQSLISVIAVDWAGHLGGGRAARGGRSATSDWAAKFNLQ
jgi:hypothetical protein